MGNLPAGKSVVYLIDCERIRPPWSAHGLCPEHHRQQIPEEMGRASAEERVFDHH
jgi:hypothetical protein